jgi:hypothetical protein
MALLKYIYIYIRARLSKVSTRQRYQGKVKQREQPPGDGCAMLDGRNSCWT